MQQKKRPSDSIKKIYSKNNQLIKIQLNNNVLEVGETLKSHFIKDSNILIAGEDKNPNPDSRKAVLICFDLLKGHISGVL
jgi:hypothetical protein